MNLSFWTLLDELVARSEVVIDRPRGSAHPRFPENISPHNYGCLSGTTSGDEQGIDVWLGNSDVKYLDAVLVRADLQKRDAELKLLLGCTVSEQQAIVTFLNSCPSFQCLLVPRL